MLNDLLRQASHALCIHDAQALETLAAEAAGLKGLPCDLTKSSIVAEALRKQIAAAAGHLKLHRRLRGTYGSEQPWER